MKPLIALQLKVVRVVFYWHFVILEAALGVWSLLTLHHVPAPDTID